MRAEIERFSPKQRRVLSWWLGPDRNREAIICDGAARSGKTVCLGLSFFCWAMVCFDGAQFALCGKTAGAVRRNLLYPLEPWLKRAGFRWREKKSENLLEVELEGRRNTFYLFGGQNEGSAGRIQGMTLAGALMDEAALMPRSFVEQVCARCSGEESRLWFSCNPEGPEHWFYREWICRAEEKRILYLHFTMEDNPGLSQAVRERYKRRFTGRFYRRFVLGEWVAAQGLVYDFFSEEMVERPPEGRMEEWRISCDYGTANPASFGLWGRQGERWYRVEEFYYDSRERGRQMTDREYADALEALAAGRAVSMLIVDPSAASFMEELRRRGFPVRKAENDVLSGIRRTAEYLKSGRIVICRPCRDTVREFGLYCWDEGAAGDRVVKRHDHAMDDIRYFCAELGRGAAEEGWAAASVERSSRW